MISDLSTARSVISGPPTFSSTKKDKLKSATYTPGHAKPPTTTKVFLIRNSPTSHQKKSKAPSMEKYKCSLINILLNHSAWA